MFRIISIGTLRILIKLKDIYSVYNVHIILYTFR